MSPAMHINLHFALALLIRVFFIFVGYIQDSHSELKYTDVDYQVFTDAALHVTEGRSPFLRPTYRYTPLVALLLVPNILLHDAFGKLLFSLSDVSTSVLVYSVQRRAGFGEGSCRMSAFFWLYNPLAVAISTRGSAESLVTFLVVLCVRLVQRPLLLGLVFGLAVHLKIYPCIYAASFYFALSSAWEASLGLVGLLLPSREKAVFIAMFAVGFLAPTSACLWLCRDEYLREALLYHLMRKDIRHNFSPFFYPLYLLESGENERLSSVVSSSAFVLQAALISLASRVFAVGTHARLPACMFVQTFLFVSLNKVCTSQYFAWYLCLLPMSCPLVEGAGSKKKVAALVVWAGGQALWLLSAYLLEFEGRNMFFLIFVSTMVFFLINIYLVCLFVKCVKTSHSFCTERKHDEIKID